MSSAEQVSITGVDIAVIVIYFVVVIAVGILATCRAKTDSAQGYFLAGRSMTWIPIGASTYASNIGAPMFIGLAGSAAAQGIPVVMFEWHAMFMLLLLGWLFLPVYRSSGCMSMPHYLTLRHGGVRIRVLFAIVFQFLIIISHISGQMYSGALFIQRIFHWNIYGAALVILAITALFTIIGGLTAVIWTDTIQTVILVVGSAILFGFALDRVGGFEALREQFQFAASNQTYLDMALYGNRTCGVPYERAWHIFQPADDGNYPWPGMVFGLTILAANAWCTDQICVQRSLSAKNVSHAKAGVTLAAYLKFLPFFFFILPGMISRVLFPEIVGCADPHICQAECSNPRGCTNIAYPLLVINILPEGIRGIMLAALLSALMSSLTSIFNSSSTVFTIDIYQRIRTKAKEGELMIVGRLWTVFLAVVSMLWLPALMAVQGSQFWNYTQAISSYVSPPMVVAFLMSVFWTRTTEVAAFSGILVGLIIGAMRMGLEWSIQAPPCGSNEPDTRFAVVSKVHYLHFAMISATICFFWILAVSLVTKPRPPEKLRRMTWWTRSDPELPELSDDEDEGEEELIEEKEYEAVTDTSKTEKVKNFAKKWLCGQETGPRQKKLTKEDIYRIQKELTDIKEDPFWTNVLNVNALICCMCAVFLHAYWA